MGIQNTYGKKPARIGELVSSPVVRGPGRVSAGGQVCVQELVVNAGDRRAHLSASMGVLRFL